MDRVEEYRRNAEEAERRAKAALSPIDREAYEKIARGWRELMEEAEGTRRRGV